MLVKEEAFISRDHKDNRVFYEKNFQTLKVF